MKKIGKTIGIIVVLALVCAGATYVWVSRVTGPDHPALAGLPDLIPVRDFYADTSAEWNFQPSNGHRFIAHEGTRGTEISLILRDGDSLAELWSEKDIDDFFWGQDPGVLFVQTEGRLWQVDVEDHTAEWVDVTPRGFGGWSFGTAEGFIPDTRIIYSRDRTTTVSDLYAVDLRGRGKRLIAENDGTILGWVMNTQGDPYLRFRRPEPGVTALERFVGADYVPVLEIPSTDTFWIVTEMAHANKYLAVSSRNRDISALVEVDLITREESIVWQHDRFDVGRVFDFDPHDGVADMVVTVVDETIRHALSEKGTRLIKMLEDFGPNTDLADMYQSPDGGHLIAALSVDMKSHVYISLDLERGTHREISRQSFSKRHLEKLPTTAQVDIPAQDGVVLHGLLTRPQGIDAPAPLIVSIHGGPGAHDSYGYNHFVQFLANRGYAVLSVNFRGSTGFGKAFQAMGYGSFGQAMQQDIYDSVDWAIAAGIADPDAVAVMGGSYGGYASAMAVLQRPEMFQTALIEHAMLDVTYQSQFPPHFWGLNAEGFARYFGDVDDPDARATMDERSPITIADTLTRPVMIVAGKRDHVVGFEQSEDFIERAEAGGANVEALIFEKAGHGLGRWQDRVTHARAVEQFLAEHLGGRSGGWDYMELAAEWF